MSAKVSLSLVQNGPFASCPPIAELTPARVRCNDVVFPWEFNPHGKRLWVIGNEYGALGAVWADHEQDALNALVDEGLGEALLVDEQTQQDADEDEREEWSHLGNAGEAADLSHAWMATVRLEAQDFKLIAAFAEARGACAESLDDYARFL